MKPIRDKKDLKGAVRNVPNGQKGKKKGDCPRRRQFWHTFAWLWERFNVFCIPHMSGYLSTWWNQSETRKKPLVCLLETIRIQVCQDYHAFEIPFFSHIFYPFWAIFFIPEGSFEIHIVSDCFFQVRKIPWHVRNPEHIESLQKTLKKSVKTAVSFENHKESNRV